MLTEKEIEEAANAYATINVSSYESQLQHLRFKETYIAGALWAQSKLEEENKRMREALEKIKPFLIHDDDFGEVLNIVQEALRDGE